MCFGFIQTYSICLLVTSPAEKRKSVKYLVRENVSGRGFLYDNANSLKRLRDTSLRSREAFFNTLTGEDVKEDNYQHTQKVWRIVGMETFGDYLKLYLQLDVLLLADVFKNFRDDCDAVGSGALHHHSKLQQTKVRVDERGGRLGCLVWSERQVQNFWDLAVAGSENLVLELYAKDP